MLFRSLQISDASGQLFCQTVGARSWKHPSARAYRFKDKTGKLAGGLKRGRFKIRRDGSIVFRTAGKKKCLSRQFTPETAFSSARERRFPLTGLFSRERAPWTNP